MPQYKVVKSRDYFRNREEAVLNSNIIGMCMCLYIYISIYRYMFIYV